MAFGRILVVSPDEDLCRSLAFALVAEGYDVTTKAELPSHSWVSVAGFDATILDQKALVEPEYLCIAFCIKAHPVILLTTDPLPWLVEWVAEIVEMPVLGNAVISAVRAATHLRA